MSRDVSLKTTPVESGVVFFFQISSYYHEFDIMKLGNRSPK